MKILKIILFTLIIAFITIQFVRPEKNSVPAPAAAQQFAFPSDVQSVLRQSCYDCHSNTTVYPWYAEIQPVAWWLAGHITDGKKELNFDEFASYRPRRQYRKFTEIEEQINNNEMPLPSYLWVHRDAELSPDDRTVLITWVNAMKDSMKTIYPIDSLERRPQRQ
jgi:hypothetical protein